MIDPQRVIEIARSTMGTPFRHQGRVVGVGIDCAGVLVHILRTLGLPHDDSRGYPRLPYEGLIESILDAQPSLVAYPKSQMQPGDVLLMRFRTEPQHVAICTGETIIHSYSAIGRVVEHRLSPVWRARIVKIYRITEPNE